jgi:outer membrane protein assembly factor BamB
MRKPKRIEIGRGDLVQGPIVTADAVYAAVKDDVTVRLDRRSLRKLWEVGSDNLWLGRAIGERLITVGGNVAGVRSTMDGQLLWTAPTRFMGVGLWRDRAIIDSQEGLELREPETGAVLQVYVVPGGYTDGRHLICGDLAILQCNRVVIKAFDLASGQVEWERPLVEELQRRLSARSEFADLRMAIGSQLDDLVVYHGGATFGIASGDGSVVWHADVWSPYAWPTVHEGRIYGQCVERFWALAEDTGATVYDVTHSELRRAGREKTGTVYKGRMAVASELGCLAIFNLADGSLASVYESKVPLWRTAEADGRLFVATGDGGLLVFDESIWGL